MLRSTLAVFLAIASACLAEIPPFPEGKPYTESQRTWLAEREKVRPQIEQIATDDLERAVGIAEKMLVVDRQTFGNVHREVASSLDFISGLYYQQQDFRSAVKSREEIVDITSKLLGEKHWRVREQKYFRDLYARLGTLDNDARSLQVKASELRTKATTLNRQGKYDEAIKAALQSSQHYESVIGKDNPSYALAIHQLAIARSRLNQNSEAETLFLEAARIFQSYYGPNSAQYGQTQYRLALIYRLREDSVRAEQAFRTAQKIFEQEADRPNLIEVHERLSMLYLDRGEISRADDCLRSALEQCLADQGKGKEKHAVLLTDLAYIQIAQKKLDDADSSCRQALEILTQLNRKETSAYRRLLETTCTMELSRKNRGKEALALAMEGRRRCEAVGTQDVFRLALFLDYESEARFQLQDYEAAEDAALKALAKRREIQDAQGPAIRKTAATLAHIRNQWARAYVADGKLEQGKRILSRNVDLAISSYGATDWRVTSWQFSVNALDRYSQLTEAQRRQSDDSEKTYEKARQLSDEGKYRDAIPLFQQVLQLREEIYGPKDSYIPELLSYIGRSQCATGQPGLAEVSLQRSARLCRELYGSQQSPDFLAAVLFVHAFVCREKGDNLEAAKLFSEARACIKSTLGTHSSFYSDATVDLALTDIDLGEIERAEMLLNENLEMQARLRGKDSHEYGWTQVGLYNLAIRSGDVQQAIKMFDGSDAVLTKANMHEYRYALHSTFGTLMVDSGQFQLAVDTFEWVLEPLEKYDSIRQQQLLTICLRGLGQAYAGKNEFDKAEATALRAVKLQRQKYSDPTNAEEREVRALAEVCQHRLAFHFMNGKLDGAVTAAERAVSLWTELFGQDHWRTRDAASRLAVAKSAFALAEPKQQQFAKSQSEAAKLPLLQSQGKTAEALKLAQNVLTDLSETVGSDTILFEDFRKTHVMSLILGAKYTEAAKQASEMVQSTSRLQGPDGELVGIAFLLSGLVDFEQARYGSAQKHFATSLAILSKATGRRSPSMGVAWMLQGRLAATAADYGKAEQSLRLSLGILFSNQSRLTQDYLMCLATYGQVCGAIGDSDRAVRLLKRALKESSRVGDSGAAYRAKAAGWLAVHYCQNHDYEAAERLMRDAVELERRIYGEKSAPYATSLQALANLLRDKGDVLLPSPLYQQSLEILTTIMGPDSLQSSNLLADRSRMHLSRGDFDQSAGDLDRSLAIRTKLKAPVEYLLPLQGDLAFQRGETAKAADAYARLIDGLLTGAASIANAQTELQQITTARSLHEALGWSLSLDPAGDNLQRVYGQVMQWKGAVLARQLRIRAARDDEKFKALFKRWEHLSGQLATFALRAPYPEEREVWMAQVRDLTSERNQIESSLARAGRGVAAQPPSPADLATALPDNVALVDFVEYGRRIPGKTPGSWESERNIVAFIVRKNLPIERVELGPTAPLTVEIDQWLKNVVDSKGDRDELVEVARLGRPIRQRLWDPLRERLKGVTTILVSPDGALSRFPLGALPGVDVDSFLCEDVGIVMIPVPLLIPELLKAPKSASGGAFVAFGDVTYGGRPGDTDVRRIVRTEQDGSRSWLPIGFSSLENTGPEVDAIGSRFASAFAASQNLVIKKSESTEFKFRQQAPQAQWLHLATHAFFVPDLMKSVFADAPEKSDSEALGVSFHPGLLSGLALAGANTLNRPDEDDGILSALEVASMDLSKVELAVLSACETAQGESAGGEGLLGLQRSFHVAGARSVLGTLWPISDVGTRLLMMRFYRNLWEKKMSKLDAIIEAQRWMMTSARAAAKAGESPTTATLESQKLPPQFLHPSYWAPFVLSGDWR